jgi:hypothetical protein
MKKLIYGVVMLLFVTVVSAQGTKEALNGEWKIVAIEVSGIYYEFTTGVIRLDESYKAQGEPSAEEIDIIREQMKIQTATVTSNFITFDKDKIKLGYGDAIREGKFQLKEKDSKTYIEATYDTGAVKEIDFALKEKLLYLILPADDGYAVNMIYKQG